MEVTTANAFFASLAVFCQVLVVALVLLAVGARLAGGVLADALAAVRRELAAWGLWLAFAVAGAATAGSLYYSEIAHFTPCRLCWFQRICMYPLALLLGIAAVRRDRGIRVYAIPLAAIGALISTWHILVERNPTLESGSCDPANPCSLKWVEQWGYLTIPTMALSGFLAIITILALLPGTTDDPEPSSEVTT